MLRFVSSQGANLVVQQQVNSNAEDTAVAAILSGLGRYCATLRSLSSWMAEDAHSSDTDSALAGDLAQDLVQFWILNRCALPIAAREGVVVHSQLLLRESGLAPKLRQASRLGFWPLRVHLLTGVVCRRWSASSENSTQVEMATVSWLYQGRRDIAVSASR